MALPYNKFNAFVEAQAEGKHNLGSDTLKILLTNTAPVATDAVKADLVEIAAGNGYVAGGNVASLISSGQTSGTYELNLNNVTFTASGGSIADFRYFVLYNDSSTADDLIAWWDNGSTISLGDGDAITFRPNGAVGDGLVLSVT